MSNNLLGIILIIIGFGLFLIGVDKKTFWELKNENFSNKFNVYEYLIASLGLIIVGFYILLK
ncbi:MAG: hypothetical protein COZ75_13370 [Flavobacteriaceae bacterium CG_4_8_14_3_um_filter_34_10]|nr:MAG: hypothetical protein AUK33_04030 [Flavobacteriaceae bacterium CG2_30_34_30]PIQ17549.1 MAG: hypothetical protein COW66_11180 [Flavobacteriaceae bacterium CG18_big_fil_WC_8_21_14_2_50_34_36]PIV51087.1 MAG: hypothetical protein COS19_02490 [Flavobacteriaceae bacterium CG02_land_8_20_14_3_00_34_13]PIX08180.1 MAG: hypothetical protein COZ75_13370 [Flavobacteriaceae bacterium CG_4_8_14_3_um_filter_34_10]PJC06899.1 MAG: hypothetical protein CO068_08850 [Flavobacteriaceae bacterium CG_4_9_14_0_